MKLFTSKEIWVWLLASLLVINLAITATILWKQYDYDVKPHHAPGMRNKTMDKKPTQGVGKWLDKMGFTEEQGKKLKALRDEFKANSETIFTVLNDNQHQIFLELHSDEPNLQRLDSLSVETGNIHARMRKALVEHMLKIREITNQEQYNQMLNMMKDWMFRGPGLQQRHWKHGKEKSFSKDTCEAGRIEK